MDHPLAMDEDGNALLAFHPAGEPVRRDDAPMPLALAALWHGDLLLLVFNRERARWELPGGLIDPGETPRQAAVRELREETGRQVEDLTFAGYARFALGAGRRIEYAALYAARVTGAVVAYDGFVPGAEISAVTWWDGARRLPGRVQPLDAALARLARRHLDRSAGDPAVSARHPTGHPTGPPTGHPTAPDGHVADGRSTVAREGPHPRFRSGGRS
ncbi:NUDIX domain-containing protein [Nonomuraea sp. NPDC047897]|uniref:NUDIX hydrolase n=1 Tax=Nonomuraea sp. NPDC047897 TaxID=3364346 RepID=UPI0037176709